MAGPASVDLDNGDIERSDPIRVILADDIAFDDPYPQMRLEPFDGLFEERRLPRAGSAHQVRDEHPRSLEPLSIFLGNAVIGLEDP
jgi:hypothetical protein